MALIEFVLVFSNNGMRGWFGESGDFRLRRLVGLSAFLEAKVEQFESRASGIIKNTTILLIPFLHTY